MSDTSLDTQQTSPMNDLGNTLVVQSGQIDPAREYTELWLPGGQIIRIATSLLRSSAQVSDMDRVNAAAAAEEIGALTIPLVEERLLVGKRTVATAKVRLEKSVQTYEEALDEPLLISTYEVDRVPRNEPVDAVPPVRQEGETTIYPLVEERMVLTKQLILREEVRVTRREAERRDTQTVVLRREHMTVDREELPRVELA